MKIQRRFPQWRAPHAVVVGIALIATLPAAHAEPPAASIDTFETQRVMRDEFLAEAQIRREAYEKFGIVPPVPASLSRNPQDPDFRFAGYAREATDAEAEEALIHGRGADSIEGEDFREDTDVGVFVNEAGEMWRWKPRNRRAVIEQAREKLGLDATAQASEAWSGKGAPRHIEGDQENERAILGTDSRNIRSADAGHSMTSYPLRAIGALAPNGRDGNSPNARCTATKFGPRHLLTAAHCVHGGGSGGGWSYKDWWGGQDGMNFYANGGDPSPNGVRDIQWYWVPSGWLDSGQNNRDYAVLILYDTPSTVGLGWLGTKVDYTLAGTSHWNFGFPIWGNTCANSNWSGNSCRNSMWGMSRNIARTTLSFAYYSHDTQDGHSGSPIYQYNGGNRKIVAVHKGAFSGLENRGVKINRQVFDNIQAVKAAWPSAYD
ncbi:MAG: serine protease [Gammaproteobacteria bacterium]